MPSRKEFSSFLEDRCKLHLCFPVSLIHDRPLKKLKCTERLKPGLVRVVESTPQPSKRLSTNSRHILKDFSLHLNCYPPTHCRDVTDKGVSVSDKFLILVRYLHDNSLQDVAMFTLRAGPEQRPIAVHKGVLARLSPAFDALVNGSMIEAQECCVAFEEVSFETASLLVQFAYRGDYDSPVAPLGPTATKVILTSGYLLRHSC